MALLVHGGAPDAIGRLLAAGHADHGVARLAESMRAASQEGATSPAAAVLYRRRA